MKVENSSKGLRFAANGPLIEKWEDVIEKWEDVIIENIMEYGVPEEDEEEITFTVWMANDNCHLHVVSSL